MSPPPGEQNSAATAWKPHAELLQSQLNNDTNPKEAVKSIQEPNALEGVLEAVGAGEVAMRIVGQLMQMNIIAGGEEHPDQKIKPSDGAAKCAILPWESRKTLVLSDISCKLNRVRRFLERDIGYVLLDDALPSSGSVGLRAKPDKRKTGLVAPNEEDLQKDQVKTLDTWVGPDMARFAKYPDDLVLVLRFMDTLEGVASRAKGETTCKTILQGVRLMHSCKYSYADIVLTLTYTSVYFRETVDQINQNMCDYEAAHVCALLMFLAHSFILDETCPLKFWQQNIFKHYCSLKILDMALFRLFRLLNFQLRISNDDEQRGLSILLSNEASAKDLDLITK
mmetsp:Transcript_67276/g.197498  ORF Transcript_67276/g.197498 Transcript_67276/m.197498 type:complete len:338 (-) Transcript_67276:317-1330(-)